MAQLNITESRKPQNGHMIFQPPALSLRKISEPIDLRLSVFPSVFGEVAVIRILTRKDLLFEKLEKLGIDLNNAEKLRHILQQSAGMVLVTGLGGSGKTTTLYTILNSLKSPWRNIITLEDPVELYLDGVHQAQIYPDIGFTFAEGVRSLLRQDPNVVMVGEIRDDETAEISIRAALTGVLFLSTLHTINSIGALIRFIELGLPRSSVAFSLRTVIAQRLLRIICSSCKTEATYEENTLEMFGIQRKMGLKFFRGEGCNLCNGTGYLGRTGIFEFLFITKEIQRLIIEGAPFTEIEAQARSEGMKTLQEIAIDKALEGITTLEEAARVSPLLLIDKGDK